MWWTNLNLFQQIFFCIGAPSALVLVLQTILVLVGIGHDSDADAGFDAEMDGDIGTGITGDTAHSGLGMFSVRGIFAFLTVAGFMGFWLGEYHPAFHYAWSAVISAAVGFLAMAGIYFLTRSLMKLQEQGNISLNNAIGHTGKVYIPIPASRSGIG
ncbi:MAG: hypothetical protein LBS99_00825, partial [Clostridiales bacterium]|nr:hypothetical protein [Clostridiales bacterium]